ncbi:bifunctional riboflavin kinase/FAD synthetase [Pelagibacteraceae bacterium]|jgi:riboflavin kinase/FMN adenylyltransferase|nr:bifunctional riboflavin kinase/FAD synthetase [Pelagibacteraceae bacterium]
MIIYKNFNLKKNLKNSVVAIGNFDGVHLGHQKVLQQAKYKALKNKTKFGAITFEPMPVMFFNKKLKNHRVQSLKQKIKCLKNQKLDFLIIKKFDKKFSNTKYQEFIKKVIFNKLHCKLIFVSKNFKFGKKREGDVKKLKSLEKKFAYKTIITTALKKNKKIISSTIIRKLISKGKVEKVKKLLGKPWSVEGKVIEGDKRGRKIGFPTCNIKISDYIIPKLGVYSVKIKGNNFLKKGIANIGYRPTFNGKNLLLEVNIFGLARNLYKKELIVSFVKFIRPEKKFNNINELKKQIKIDIKKSKK